MLQIEIPTLYQVKKGQTIKEIARAFCVSEFALVKENALKSEPYAGQILRVPSENGNAYFAQENQEKSLLCGSVENFYKKNATDCLYPGMRVIL